MGYVCKKCGSNQFVGHQIIRMNVIVDGANNWISEVTPNAPMIDVYDSGIPYGHYQCCKCGEDVIDGKFIGNCKN